MVRDPSTESWRATLGPFPIKLRETQASLAASQADLTAMQAERDALAVLNAELKAEAASWREAAERLLADLDETARALATANHDNRILTAEKEADRG